MQWGERKVQLLFESLSEEFQNLECVWLHTEPAPLYGENLGGLPDTGFIGLYLCLRFVET